MPELIINEFDPKSIPLGSICMFIGKRNTGKSFTMRDILYHKRNEFQVAKLVCETEKLNRDYSSIIPKIFTEYEFDENSIYKFLKRQYEVFKQNQKGANINPNAVLIFDDMLASGDQWIKSRYVKKCFMNGRHYKFDFMISLQHCIGIPPQLRGQVDYIFLFREFRVNELEKIYEHYASLIPSFHLFRQIMDKLTKDYGCLIIKNVKQSEKWYENIFFYKAQKHPEFRLCPPEAWAFNDIDSDSDDEVNIKYGKNKIIFK